MTGPAWRRYLRFWGSDIGADLDDELRFHIEARFDEYVAAGMTPEQARAEAMRRFGDLERVRQSCEHIDHLTEQERRRADMRDILKQDLRYAVRGLRRNPGFSLVAVLTLALGIGANTAIFSVVNGVLLRPLPYPESQRLVRLFAAFRARGEERFALSEPEFLDYKALTHVFENAAAYGSAGLTLTGVGDPERLRGIRATRDLLPTLGISPARGRNFDENEGREGTAPVVIVTHELWQNRFGGDPGLLERSLMLNGVSHRVIGILPEGSTLGRAQLFVPMVARPDAQRTIHGLSALARLRPGVTIEQAQREVNAVARRLNEQYPGAYPPSLGHGANVVSMLENTVGDVRTSLLVLLGAVGLVLLIACANVANLLLARGEARQQEMAVRLALGASRTRVVAQLLTESTMLALLGAALGALLARWGLQALLAVNPDGVPRAQEIRLDLTVGVVTLGLAVLTGVLFGLAPAVQLARNEVQSRLKEGGRGGSEGGRRQRLGRALVAAEVALAVVVVIGAALLMRSFWSLRNVDPGFRPENLLTIDLAVPQARYDMKATTVFYQRLVERLAALPGAEVAAAASDLPPLAGRYVWDVFIEGRPIPPGQAAPTPNMRAVTRDYFRAMSIPMVRGRPFGPEDRESSLPVAVINETAARTIWGTTDAIGTRFRFDKPRPWITVVGVARDSRSHGLAEPAPAEVFMLHEQLPTAGGGTERAMFAVVRTAAEPTALAAPARRVVAELDPLLAIIGIRSMTEMVARSVARPRFTMLLLGVFGAVALTLAAIGIFGIMSYAVRRRTREIGIRVALGAQPRAVLRLVVGQGMRLALLGLAIGLVGAFLATRLMAGMVYGVGVRDPATFVGVGLLLGAVALVASWLPARRAVLTDPTTALRAE
jgi:putative ABC transport system permease protein